MKTPKIKLDYKIANIKYGYYIEQLEKGLFRLVYQKWDDGISWPWEFPSNWAEYDDGSLQHIYRFFEDAQRDGNAFMIQQAAYEVLEIENMYVAWFWNEGESKASKFPIDNLKIYDSDYQELWSISNLFKQSEICTGIHLIDRNKFYFYTFSGIGITIEIKYNEIKCIEKKLVR